MLPYLSARVTVPKNSASPLLKQVGAWGPWRTSGSNEILSEMPRNSWISEPQGSLPNPCPKRQLCIPAASDDSKLHSSLGKGRASTQLVRPCFGHMNWRDTAAQICAFRQRDEQSGEAVNIHRRGSSATRAGRHFARMLCFEGLSGFRADLITGNQTRRHEL